MLREYNVKYCIHVTKSREKKILCTKPIWLPKSTQYTLYRIEYYVYTNKKMKSIHTSEEWKTCYKCYVQCRYDMKQKLNLSFNEMCFMYIFIYVEKKRSNVLGIFLCVYIWFQERNLLASNITEPFFLHECV